MSRPTELPSSIQGLSTGHVLSRLNQRVLVVAHRGIWKSAPENSLAAIDAAIALGADIVEIDVQSTVDGVLVCLHDDTLERTTDGVGALVQCTCEAVRQYHLRAADGLGGAALTDERVPLLAEVLDAARGRVLLNLDIKTGDLADQVADAVIGAGMADQVIMKAAIDSDDDIRWARSRRFFGRIAFMPIMTAHAGRFAFDLARLAPLDAPMVEVAFTDFGELDAGLAERERQDIRLWINTLDVFHNLDYNDTRALADADAVWGRLLDAGVGAIQTDESAVLIDYLRLRGRR